MARPVKCGVDYFSHDTVSGKTIFTLEAQFGNDGYAFWFKLLELLGTQEGLYYDCGNPADWMFLIAKTRVDEETATKILDLLAALGAIDAELWQQKIIWVQKFVDRLAEVFKKRASGIPQKPSFRRGNPAKEEVSDAESTQSKGKESKEKVKESNNAHTREGDIFKDRSFSPKMQDKLTEWLKYKAERRESYKPTGLTAFLTEVENKLKEYSEADIIALIGECMANNWRGIIWDKIKGRASPRQSHERPVGGDENKKKKYFDRPTENYDHLAFNPFEEITGLKGE